MGNLTDWLKEQAVFPKVYWREKGREFAGAGKKSGINDIPLFANERYFGGVAFTPGKREEIWRSFPSCYFFVPLITKEQEISENGKAWDKPKITQRRDLPNYTEWERSVETALEAIRSEKFQKVVLARRTTLTFNQEIDPFALLQKISQNVERETLFAFQFSPDAAFIGATPEKLYVRDGLSLSSDAIAGTQPRGEAVFTDKLQREFSHVPTWIQNTLAPLCTEISIDKKQVIGTKNLEHLYRRIAGNLKPGITDSDLLQALHPTPAMGGFPQEPALAHLFSYEPFDRGWYAAPLGYVSEKESSFSVGIRSALICGDKVHLFAGAGIVEGSDPRAEWEELELKIAEYAEVLL